MADLAPRDVVARAIVARMALTGSDHVLLDARHLGREFLERRFPSIVARCRELGFDPATEPLPVAPAQHYASGGVETDLLGRSSLEGLYACGEVSCTGVHGANRLASNSLLEGIVFASRIADDITDRLAAGELPPTTARLREGPPTLVGATERTMIQRAMTAGAGAVRSAGSLASTAAALAAIAAAADQDAAGGDGSPGGVTPGPQSWETSNLLHVGQLLTAVALQREETRGGHVRSDFPDRDDARFRGHIRARRTPGGPVGTTYTPVASAAEDLLAATHGSMPQEGPR
jgi:L-aspartate oxidase